MLSNLASYLGYSSAPVDRTPPATITADVRVRDEEDDWVLVDPNDRESGSGPAAAMATQPSDVDDGITRVTLAISTCPANLPGSSKNLSRSVSLDISCPLQESWYLTPPPSFTSDGPVHMETSPLENMLIEHPSMSVYEHTSRTGPSQAAAAATVATAVSSPPSPDEDPAMMTAEPASPTSATRHPTRKEKLKVSRNKVNANKFSKKLTAKRANEEGECEDTETKTLEAKEPKIKSFVKSPRRIGQSQRVPNVTPFDQVISGNGKCEIGAAGSEPQVVPTRKLYSEVLASKPKAATPVPVAEEPQTTAVEPVATTTLETKEQEVPETTAAESPSESSAPAAAAVVAENEMSVEEGSPEEEGLTEEAEDVSERRRGGAVQIMVEHQQRQNFLTRSAQKVEQRKTCDLMKRNPLLRTNKAREINFRNKRQRRADMMQRHSGANNNRKC